MRNVDGPEEPDTTAYERPARNANITGAETSLPEKVMKPGARNPSTVHGRAPSAGGGPGFVMPPPSSVGGFDGGGGGGGVTATGSFVSTPGGGFCLRSRSCCSDSLRSRMRCSTSPL